MCQVATAKIPALSQGAPCGTLRVAVTSPPDTPLPALLRAALEERHVSVKELARRLSSDAGTAVESERRGLQRYLKGEVTPEPEKAAAIARALDQPEEQFVQTARLQRSIPELLLEIDARLETLAAELRSRDAKTRGSRQTDRLRTLEKRMEEQGKAVRDSLAAILKILEQRENGARAKSPASRPASRRKAF